MVVNIRAEERAPKGELVKRQRAIVLRFRTDTDLPERLDTDISDAATTIGTEAARTSSRY